MLLLHLLQDALEGLLAHHGVGLEDLNLAHRLFDGLEVLPDGLLVAAAHAQRRGALGELAVAFEDDAEHVLDEGRVVIVTGLPALGTRLHGAEVLVLGRLELRVDGDVTTDGEVDLVEHQGCE